MKTEPKAASPLFPGKDIQGDFTQFTSFMQKLVAVPHAEIKARLEADRAAKTASRAAGVSGTRRP